ncbi:trimeric intracellular cation channel family protein [Rhodococcus spelaei]|uniref:Trimeric intracellular cation channel family protein n=1 Tax=Rhodococcus spelaei TaxID=2546320 RepID=A0A541BP35_9NOCA|nr:trimeric intracellular cation channel family protein [Rhodococcus spelaei]TQF74050.1 trimeric intracellular cation channel family protein [Rhodococcus spelaei]
MLLKIVELIGVVAFAASGSLVAVSKRLDIFGVCLIGVFTAIGGGVLRDVLLGITPPTSLNTWRFFTTAVLTSLVVFFLHAAVRRLRREILVLDAVGMGLFASSGAAIALDAGASGQAACLIGATTAIGGGVLRDVLVNEIPLLLQRDLYAIPALIGSTAVVACSGLGLNTDIALVVGTISASAIRLVALWRHWSLPGPRLVDD